MGGDDHSWHDIVKAGNDRDALALEWMEPMVNDRDENIPIAIAKAAHDIGGSRANALLRTLKSHKKKNVRWYANFLLNMAEES